MPDTATITEGIYGTAQHHSDAVKCNSDRRDVVIGGYLGATVDANGKVTGVGAGKVAIYATGKVLQSNEEKDRRYGGVHHCYRFFIKQRFDKQ